MRTMCVLSPEDGSKDAHNLSDDPDHDAITPEVRTVQARWPRPSCEWSSMLGAVSNKREEITMTACSSGTTISWPYLPARCRRRASPAV